MSHNNTITRVSRLNNISSFIGLSHGVGLLNGRSYVWILVVATVNMTKSCPVKYWRNHNTFIVYKVAPQRIAVNVQCVYVLKVRMSAQNLRFDFDIVWMLFYLSSRTVFANLEIYIKFLITWFYPNFIINQIWFTKVFFTWFSFGNARMRHQVLVLTAHPKQKKKTWKADFSSKTFCF